MPILRLHVYWQVHTANIINQIINMCDDFEVYVLSGNVRLAS